MIDVRRSADVVDRGAAEREIERIFFAASGTQTFPDETVRAVFRERWLGRYVAHDPDKIFVALDAGGAVVGYLVGSFDDPAQTARFSDIGYFAELAHVTARYPAHLHVNLDERVRGAGLGSRLVEAFCAEALAAKMPGVHIVTGRGLRNVAFYQRLGFRERGAAISNGRDVVMLCRELA